MRASTGTAGKAAAARASKSTFIVTLRLSTDILSKFPSGSSSASSSASPAAADVEAKSEVDPSTANTPQTGEAGDATPIGDANGKKTTTAAVKAGVKRPSSAQDAAIRPGPKKKIRLTDGPNDRSTPTAKRVGGAAATGTAKGPRGNTGAINAGLRALDRSGKPCRKWHKKGFELKSFTGVQWSFGSWSAPKVDSNTFAGDVKSDTSSSAGVDASNVPAASQGSSSSNTGDNTALADGPVNGLASSPVPAPA